MEMIIEKSEKINDIRKYFVFSFKSKTSYIVTLGRTFHCNCLAGQNGTSCKHIRFCLDYGEEDATNSTTNR